MYKYVFQCRTGLTDVPPQEHYNIIIILYFIESTVVRYRHRARRRRCAFGPRFYAQLYAGRNAISWLLGVPPTVLRSTDPFTFNSFLFTFVLFCRGFRVRLIRHDILLKRIISHTEWSEFRVTKILKIYCCDIL